MLDPEPLAIEWVVSGAVVTLLGGLIKFAGWTWLLAGYSESTAPIADDVVQDVAGNTILRIGIVVLVVGALASVTTLPAFLTIVVGAAIVVDILRMLYWFNVNFPSGMS